MGLQKPVRPSAEAFTPRRTIASFLIPGEPVQSQKRVDDVSSLIRVRYLPFVGIAILFRKYFT